MENFHEKYRPQIDKCFKEIDELIALYEKILAKNPRDQNAENKRSQLYFYKNQKKNDLKDMPNREYDYMDYIDSMNKYISSQRENYNDTYIGKAKSSYTKKDAKEALDKALVELDAAYKELKDFNLKYKAKGNHTDNYAAIKAMKEIEKAKISFKEELIKEEKKPSPDYESYINHVKSDSNHYSKYAKSTIRDQQYYG